MEIKLQDLKISSGARRLIDNIMDFVCYVYTKEFLQYLELVGKLKKSGTEVAIAGDSRQCTDRIMEAVRRAGNLKIS